MKNIFPDSEVSSTQINERPIRVTIASGGKTLVEVAQRDLFAKNGWPAEKAITEALTKLKKEQGQ